MTNQKPKTDTQFKSTVFYQQHTDSNTPDIPVAYTHTHDGMVIMNHAHKTGRTERTPIATLDIRVNQDPNNPTDICVNWVQDTVLKAPFSSASNPENTADMSLVMLNSTYKDYASRQRESYEKHNKGFHQTPELPNWVSQVQRRINSKWLDAYTTNGLRDAEHHAIHEREDKTVVPYSPQEWRMLEQLRTQKAHGELLYAMLETIELQMDNIVRVAKDNELYPKENTGDTEDALYHTFSQIARHQLITPESVRHVLAEIDNVQFNLTHHVGVQNGYSYALPRTLMQPIKSAWEALDQELWWHEQNHTNTAVDIVTDEILSAIEVVLQRIQDAQESVLLAIDCLNESPDHMYWVYLQCGASTEHFIVPNN